MDKDGATYEGEFVNDKKSGRGHYLQPGKKLEIEGTWLNDLVEGKTGYTLDGKKYEAIFRGGNLESKRELPS